MYSKVRTTNIKTQCIIDGTNGIETIGLGQKRKQDKLAPESASRAITNGIGYHDVNMLCDSVIQFGFSFKRKGRVVRYSAEKKYGEGWYE